MCVGFETISLRALCLKIPRERALTSLLLVVAQHNFIIWIFQYLDIRIFWLSNLSKFLILMTFNISTIFFFFLTCIFRILRGILQILVYFPSFLFVTSHHEFSGFSEYCSGFWALFRILCLFSNSIFPDFWSIFLIFFN